MPSDEVRVQKQRLERIARDECPGLTVAFDDGSSPNLRFSLHDSETGKRSGRSAPASGAQLRDQEERLLRKLLRLMADQCRR